MNMTKAREVCSYVVCVIACFLMQYELFNPATFAHCVVIGVCALVSALVISGRPVKINDLG